MNLLTDHARELLEMPPEWNSYHLEVIGYTQDANSSAKLFKITGAVAPLKTRGEHKGMPNWNKRDRATEKTVFITPEEHDRWVQEWEKKTGKCADCTGSGKQLSGWSVTEGAKYRPCKKCSETGKAAGYGR